MKNKYSSTLLAAAFGLALSGSANAAIIAGWDAWADTTTAYNADILETGFTATAASGTDRIIDGFGSADGTFGADVSGASTSDDNGFLPRETGGNLVLTITLNNNSGSAYTIDSMHFDFGERTNGPDTFVVDYVSGGLGPDNTQIGSGSTTDVGVYKDFDFATSALTDTELGIGESAEFTITFSGGVGGNNSSKFDNLAFQGSAIPEPSTALLGALGLLALLRRRR